MSKKRKKHSLQEIQKTLNARHRNDYFKRLNVFIKALTGEDVLALMPAKERERLYQIRMNAIIAEPFEGHDVPPEIIEAIKGIVNWWFKKRPIPIEKTKQNVYMAQYHAFGFSIGTYLAHLKDVNYNNAARVQLRI